MKQSIFIFLILLLPLSIQAQAKLDPRLSKVDTLINRILIEWNVPGCAVTIVEKNKVLLARGYGYRDLSTKRLVDEHTVFPLASCTKVFTAALIGILAQEGKLDIDQPANNYIPLLKFSDPLLNLMVTPRDMMTHRTGIPRHDISWYGFEKSPRDSLVQLIQYFEKSAGFREKFQYNNYMYTALGALAENVNGSISWEQQITERFFIPLNMDHSNVSFEEMEAIENKATPYAVSFQMAPVEMPFQNSDNMGPCGAINSTARDISNWLITWINGGTYNGEVVIPPDFYRQSISTQWGSPAGPSGKIHYLGYGLGWNMAIYQGHYSVFHGGATDGFGSLVLLLPSDSLGMAIFINSRTSPVPMIIANHITDNLLGLPYTDWSTLQLIEFKNQQKKYESEFFEKGSPGFPPSHNQGDYCGIYTNPGYGKISIFMRGDSLVGRYGSLKLWLKHNNYDAYSGILYHSDEILGFIDVWNRPLIFHQNSEGDISGFSFLLERRVDPIIFKKKKLGN